MFLVPLLIDYFINNKIVECDSDSECPFNWHCITQADVDYAWNPRRLREFNMASEQRKCVLKNLKDANGLDVFGFLALSVFCVLAIAGGVGGGFIYIVIIMFVFNFDTTYGTPMVYVMVFCATITRFGLDLQTDHPQLPGQSVICWDIVLCCMPSILFGNMVGVFVYIVLPDFAVMIIFTVIVLNDFIGIFKKYRELNSNTNTNTNNKSTEMQVVPQIEDIETKETKENYKEQDNIANETENVKNKESLTQYNDEYSRHEFMWSKFLLAVLALVANILTSFLRGSNKEESVLGFKFCDTWSWIIFGLYSILSVSIVLLSVWLLRKYEIPSISDSININKTDTILPNNVENQNQLDKEEERLYGSYKLFKLCLTMIYVGLIAGILGIGGGLLLGPLMLTLLKMRPEVQGATTNVLVFSKSIAGVVQLFILGTLYLDWGLLLGVLSLLSAYMSKSIFSYLKSKFGSSVFVLALLIIILLALLITPAMSTYKTVESYKAEGISVLQTTGLCSF